MVRYVDKLIDITVYDFEMYVMQSMQNLKWARLN